MSDDSGITDERLSKDTDEDPKKMNERTLSMPLGPHCSLQKADTCIEGDHQLNSKRWGKIAMMLADGDRKLIAAEQYGCRKNHRSIEVVLNSRLIDDIVRILHQPGIICSNDAESCFDRIVH